MSTRCGVYESCLSDFIFGNTIWDKVDCGFGVGVNIHIITEWAKNTPHLFE